MSEPAGKSRSSGSTPADGGEQALASALPTVPNQAADDLAVLWSSLTAAGRTERCWLFTAAQRREGVTEMVVALASMVVRQNMKLRIGLVEANWRHPRMSDIFGLEPKPGLFGLLNRTSEFEAATVSLAGGGLVVLPVGQSAGKQPPAAESIASVINAMKSRVDYVFVDAPAVSKYPDADIIGPATDGVVLIARAGITRRESIAEAQRRLELAGSRVIGMVLSRRMDPIPEALYKRL